MKKVIIERDFKGVWIPKEIYLNTNLSWIEKILLVEIDSLSKLNKGCFASNAYFAKLLNLSLGSTNNLLSKLQKAGYIINEFDGINNFRRVDFTNLLNPPSQICETPLHKNVKHNNIDLTNHKTKPSKTKTAETTPPEISRITDISKMKNRIENKKEKGMWRRGLAGLPAVKEEPRKETQAEIIEKNIDPEHTHYIHRVKEWLKALREAGKIMSGSQLKSFCKQINAAHLQMSDNDICAEIERATKNKWMKLVFRTQ